MAKKKTTAKKAVKKKAAKKAAKKKAPAKKKAVKKKVAKAPVKKAAKKAAKKPAKIKAPKKKAAKKSAKKTKKTGVEITITKKLLGRAPTERHFYLADGTQLGSVIDLADALRGMSDDIFGHHVAEGKNDFANWIHEVFEEPDFADEIRALNDKVDTEIACLRKLIEELKAVKKKR